MHTFGIVELNDLTKGTFGDTSVFFSYFKVCEMP